MRYKLGYIDENPGARIDFNGFFEDTYDVHLFDINEETTLESLVDDMVNAELDLIVVDYELSGDGVLDFDADQLIERFTKLKPYFPYIILTYNRDDALDHIHDANIIYDKEEDMIERPESFKKIIKYNIDDYINKINKNKRLIEELSLKKNKEGLDTQEEEIFSRALMFENDLDPKIKDLPTHMTNLSEVTKINSFLKETQEIKLMLEKILK
ncbi:hypothetical protein L5F41_05380 [Aliarcobacter butzleri]|uniref:hypothetical protein n=1 Tax=Aliarcobacter butzleri TaxID=28197 RepID=UPI001ED9F1AE|nr:hypothetical protein [Aliarcobacter butzleri]MCG3701527.1 hypothetical protein [Aliarcobacter butzleri]